MLVKKAVTLCRNKLNCNSFSSPFVVVLITVTGVEVKPNSSDVVEIKGVFVTTSLVVTSVVEIGSLP